MSVVPRLIRVWHNIICINMVGHNDKCYQCDVSSKLLGVQRLNDGKTITSFSGIMNITAMYGKYIL